MTLRIAVPNKGSLSQAATDILRESGYRQRSDSKELALIDADTHPRRCEQELRWNEAYHRLVR